MNKHSYFNLKHHQGFSLVELLVAIAIGIVLITGLASVFANSSQTGSEIDKSIRQIENGRYALQALSEDINLAGYYGEVFGDGVTSVDAAPLCPTDSAFTIASLGWDNATLRVPVGLTGLSASEIATASGAQTVALSTCLPNYKTGTPALVVRRVDPSLVTIATIGSNYHVQSSNCITDPTATKFVFSVTAADFTLKNANCSAENKVRRYVMRVYYIATCSDCPNDTIPTLKKAEMFGTQWTVSPVSEGIDDMGLDFAFDTDGNGMADQYLAGLVPALLATNTWVNVVGVRINLLTRTTEPSAGFTDSRIYNLGLSGTRGTFTDGNKRRVLTATARINNIAGQREVQ